jgi:Ca2+-binding EF-hand superfamily protein
MTSITLEKFYKAIEKFVNKDPKEWQRLRFAIYDTKGKGKVTEKALFKFI